MVWALQNRRPHNFENKCYECHVGPKNPLILTREADYLCLTCHPEQKELSHPTGINPAITPPADFPLYKGELKCITCHIAHKTYDENDNQHKKFDENPFLLRSDKTGRVFCYQCHYGGPEGFIINKTDSHAVGLKRAHNLSHNISLSEVLDDSSAECLSCHDGTLSIETNMTIGGAEWEHAGRIGVSHPIGINYKKVYMKKQKTYRNPASINKIIKFFNGNIGCETCHSHYSDIPKLLVMENKRSRLCLQCHNL